MMIKQFHDEAVRLMEHPRITAAAFDIPGVSGNVKDMTPSLLLRLLLNGWITDKEKVFLDSVVPQDCLTFLIHGMEYIHPEGLELFPFEEIETTILHGGEAIFSHRYRPKQMKDTHQEYRIFSAAVNPGETRKIILGFFGPAHRLGTIDEDCGFSRLVDTFRHAYAGIKGELSMLKQCLSNQQATILVSRSTGRIQALNNEALRLFARPDHAMVDIGLDQLKYHLAPLLSDYNLRMDNIAVAEIGISVVTLEPNCGQIDYNREIMQQLSNQIRSSVASINVAGNRLQNLSSMSEDIERYRLSQTIQTEAGKISLTEKQLSFFATDEGAERVPQTIEAELRKAITSVESTGKKITSPTPSHSGAVITAPRNACQVLFESVLMDLADYCGTDGDIAVSMDELDATTLKVNFEAQVESGLSVETINGHNGAFARHMAGTLGIEMSTDLNINKNTLITEITIKK